MTNSPNQQNETHKSSLHPRAIGLGLLLLGIALFSALRIGFLSIGGAFGTTVNLCYLVYTLLYAIPAILIVRSLKSRSFETRRTVWLIAWPALNGVVFIAAFLFLAPRLLLLEAGWFVFALFALAQWIWPRRWLLGLTCSAFVLIGGFLCLEVLFSILPTPRQQLPDYPHLYSTSGMHEGGFLKPDIDEMVIGAGRPVRWITNSKGFRNDREYDPRPTTDTLRVLFLGDSFAAGYRIDQQETSGALLERLLAERLGSPVEVIVCCLEEPVHAALWMEQYGVDWHPDAVVYALCIGNDFGQALHTNMDEAKDTFDLMLPAAATRRPDPATLLLTCLRVDFRERTAWGMRLRPLIDRLRPEAVTSQHGDRFGGIHVFDGVNGLGIFYVPLLDAVRRAFEVVESALLDLDRTCGSIDAPLLVVAFPQWFQVDPRAWQAAIDLYFIDPGAFDLKAPNRRLREFCAARGIDWLDLRTPFRIRSRQERLYMPLGDMHFNQAGHALVAKSVAERILEIIPTADESRVAEPQPK